MSFTKFHGEPLSIEMPGQHCILVSFMTLNSLRWLSGKLARISAGALSGAPPLDRRRCGLYAVGNLLFYLHFRSHFSTQREYDKQWSLFSLQLVRNSRHAGFLFQPNRVLLSHFFIAPFSGLDDRA